MASISEEVQKTEPNPYVVLWELDLTDVGDNVYHFVEAKDFVTPVSWGGTAYIPFDIDADGFEWNGQGPIPTPKVRFSTINLAITGLVNSLSDLVGGKVTRTRTFRNFLDGQPDANPNEYFSQDIYRINTKTAENKIFVEFELSSFLDQNGIMLPRGVLSTYCRAIYRKWNAVTSSFDYSPTDLACPFVDSAYYTEDSVPTADPAQDVCSHLVPGCKARFGAQAVLPFMAFPGTAKPTIS
jgi:lambda family phage minor tail protein L